MRFRNSKTSCWRRSARPPAIGVEAPRSPGGRGWPSDLRPSHRAVSSHARKPQRPGGNRAECGAYTVPTRRSSLWGGVQNRTNNSTSWKTRTGAGPLIPHHPPFPPTPPRRLRGPLLSGATPMRVRPALRVLPLISRSLPFSVPEIPAIPWAMRCVPGLSPLVERTCAETRRHIHTHGLAQRAGGRP